MTKPNSTPESTNVFTSAEWYDRGINWSARLGREIPVFVDVFGPPASGKILDAGCGTGHQACGMNKRGYRVTGIDASPEMLEIAAQTAKAEEAIVEFVLTPYAGLYDKIGGGFDGVFCIGNALAAAGSREAVAEAIGQFARCLRPGGRLFLQVLNFPPMRAKEPCVLGPRISKFDGQEYVSVRQFHFNDDAVQVTSISMWNDGSWHQRASCGMLYPMTLDELRGWCENSGLEVESTWHSYAREPFEPDRSTDLILVAKRR